MRTGTVRVRLWLLALCSVPTLPAQHDAPLRAPVPIEADGLPIETGTLDPLAHAGPALGDVDGDGDFDLLVGLFRGEFWYFENRGDNRKPDFTSRGPLRVQGKPRGEALRVRTQ